MTPVTNALSKSSLFVLPSTVLLVVVTSAGAAPIDAIEGVRLGNENPATARPFLQGFSGAGGGSYSLVSNSGELLMMPDRIRYQRNIDATQAYPFFTGLDAWWDIYGGWGGSRYGTFSDGDFQNFDFRGAGLWTWGDGNSSLGIGAQLVAMDENLHGSVVQTAFSPAGEPVITLGEAGSAWRRIAEFKFAPASGGSWTAQRLFGGMTIYDSVGDPNDPANDPAKERFRLLINPTGSDTLDVNGLMFKYGGSEVITVGTLAGTLQTTAISPNQVITANGGLVVPASQSLTASGNVTLGGTGKTTTITGSAVFNDSLITLSKPVSSNSSISAMSLSAMSITANGLLTANGGVTIPSSQTLAASGNVTMGGPGKTITANSTVTANGGVTIPSSQALTASGSVTMGGPGKTTTINGATTVAIFNDTAITLSRPLTTNSAITATSITASSSIAANGGLSIPAGATATFLGTVTVPAKGGVSMGDFTP